MVPIEVLQSGSIPEFTLRLNKSMSWKPLSLLSVILFVDRWDCNVLLN